MVVLFVTSFVTDNYKVINSLHIRSYSTTELSVVVYRLVCIYNANELTQRASALPPLSLLILYIYFLSFA